MGDRVLDAVTFGVFFGVFWFVGMRYVVPRPSGREETRRRMPLRRLVLVTTAFAAVMMLGRFGAETL